MSHLGPWQRVTARHRCTVCDKPDWCLVHQDNTATICMRVASDRPLPCGGWLHKRGSVTPPRRPALPTHINYVHDWDRILRVMGDNTDSAERNRYAQALGVAPHVVAGLGVVYAEPYDAWGWPMRSATGEVIGIRLRSDTRKWAVTGSHQGLFFRLRKPAGRVYIVEGPTDTAAALSIGLEAIGRPSCTGGVDLIREWIGRHSVRETVIVADSDDPGVNGAETLSAKIGIRHCVVTLPKKDMRAYVCAGGSYALVESIVRGALWR